MSIYDQTRNLLKNRPHWLTFTEISRDTEISVDWLSKFNRGLITNPGVNTIETLKCYLVDVNEKAE